MVATSIDLSDKSERDILMILLERDDRILERDERRGQDIKDLKESFAKDIGDLKESIDKFTSNQTHQFEVCKGDLVHEATQRQKLENRVIVLEQAKEQDDKEQEQADKQADKENLPGRIQALEQKEEARAKAEADHKQDGKDRTATYLAIVAIVIAALGLLTAFIH